MTKKINKKKWIGEVFIILAEAFSVLFFFKRTILLALILFSLSLYCVIFRYDKADKISYLVAFIVGPAVEIGAIYRGAWTYAVADFMLIPFWLPFAWGVVIVAVRRISNLIIDF